MQNVASPNPGAPVRAQSRPPKPMRLLVADDDHLLATGLASDLRTLGYTVLGPAQDGAAAVELAAKEQTDLAILDIRMPKVDGLEAAATL